MTVVVGVEPAPETSAKAPAWVADVWSRIRAPAPKAPALRTSSGFSSAGSWSGDSRTTLGIGLDQPFFAVARSVFGAWTARSTWPSRLSSASTLSTRAWACSLSSAFTAPMTRRR
jgi:hypothetical protein